MHNCKNLKCVYRMNDKVRHLLVYWPCVNASNTRLQQRAWNGCMYIPFISWLIFRKALAVFWCSLFKIILYVCSNFSDDFDKLGIIIIGQIYIIYDILCIAIHRIRDWGKINVWDKQIYKQDVTLRWLPVVIMLTSHQLEISKVDRFAARYYTKVWHCWHSLVGGPPIRNRYMRTMIRLTIVSVHRHHV